MEKEDNEEAVKRPLLVNKIYMLMADISETMSRENYGIAFLFKSPYLKYAYFTRYSFRIKLGFFRNKMLHQCSQQEI